MNNGTGVRLFMRVDVVLNGKIVKLRGILMDVYPMNCVYPQVVPCVRMHYQTILQLLIYVV